MARTSKYLGSSNWKLNMMLPPTISAVSTVLVKRSHLDGSSDYVQVFPDQHCLDTHVTHSVKRDRLANPVPVGVLPECGEGSSHEVVRCNLI